MEVLEPIRKELLYWYPYRLPVLGKGPHIQPPHLPALPPQGPPPARAPAEGHGGLWHGAPLGSEDVLVQGERVPPRGCDRGVRGRYRAHVPHGKRRAMAGLRLEERARPLGEEADRTVLGRGPRERRRKGRSRRSPRHMAREPAPGTDCPHHPRPRDSSRPARPSRSASTAWRRTCGGIAAEWGRSQVPGPAARALASAWVRLLAPFIPYTCEALWEALGEKGPIAFARWPEADQEKIRPDAELAEEILAGPWRTSSPS